MDTMTDEIRRELARACVANEFPAAYPKWDGNVPLCDEDACPHYDGKRCKLLGLRPDRICEPVAREIGDQLAALAQVPLGNKVVDL